MTDQIKRRNFVTGVAVGGIGLTAPPPAPAQRPGWVTQIGADGAVDTGKPYFPMLLGNGIDHVLIGYSGTMGACAAHEQWQYEKTITGWFKSDRRGPTGGSVLNLLQCGYIVRRGVDADGIDAAEQSFDAASGTLFTQCRLANAEIQVTTFLTDDHLLVHKFFVTPKAADMWLQFFVKDPALGGATPALAVEESGAVLSPYPSALAFSLKAEDLENAGGMLAADSLEAKKVTCYNRQLGLEIPLRSGTEFSVIVGCWDAEDTTGSPPGGYATLSRRHQRQWHEYDSHSRLKLSHPPLDEIYRTSLYTLRAHQHPTNGGITVGAYPGMWTNGINSYDVSFDLMALLGSNRLIEAERVVRGWQRMLPAFQEVARNAGFPGASCTAAAPQSGKSDFRTSREAVLERRHFLTANIAIHVWQLYRYTGRPQILEKYWDCLAEPVKFLLGACIKEYPDHAEIVRSSGPNGKERVGGKVVYHPNPLRSLIATIEAISAIRRAANLLGKKPDPEWDRLLPKLRRGIEANRFGGIIRASRHPQAPPRVDTSYVGLFDCPADEATFRADLEYMISPDGLLRWPNHGYKVVPWIHCNVSAALSRLGAPGAAEMLVRGAEFTSTLFAFPEAVRPDGVYSKTWYPTVHGSFVNAVNLLLIRSRNDQVDLFPGLPEEWGDASFETLRVPLGLVVSGSRTKGKISAKVTNDSGDRQSLHLHAFGTGEWEKPVELDPGQSVAL